MTDLTDDKIQEIVGVCKETLKRSYCIYSDFPVACVLVTDCDKTFTGCNVENASYGLTICAERTAVVKAVSEGYLKFKACFVMTKTDMKISPCGACRQFLAEFGLGLTIYLISQDGDYSKCLLSELLPQAFEPKHLPK